MSPPGVNPLPDLPPGHRGGRTTGRRGRQPSTWPPRQRAPRRPTSPPTVIALLLINIAMTAAILLLTVTGR